MIKEKGRYNATYQHQGMNSWVDASNKIENTYFIKQLVGYHITLLFVTIAGVKVAKDT
jgi:hypothetical protein